jgi:hypothetical protein
VLVDTSVLQPGMYLFAARWSGNGRFLPTLHHLGIEVLPLERRRSVR